MIGILVIVMSMVWLVSLLLLWVCYTWYLCYCYEYGMIGILVIVLSMLWLAKMFSVCVKWLISQTGLSTRGGPSTPGSTPTPPPFRRCGSGRVSLILNQPFLFLFNFFVLVSRCRTKYTATSVVENYSPHLPGLLGTIIVPFWPYRRSLPQRCPVFVEYNFINCLFSDLRSRTSRISRLQFSWWLVSHEKLFVSTYFKNNLYLNIYF